MYSLTKSFKLPEDWCLPPCDHKFINDCYNELTAIGLFEDNKKNLAYSHCITSTAAYYFPKMSYEQLMIAGRLINFGFFFDDYLEIDSKSNDSITLTKKITNILIRNQSKPPTNESISKLEKYLYFILDGLQKFCKQYNITEYRYQQFIKHYVDWINSCFPFIKATNISHYDTYNFFKKVNSGTAVCLSLVVLLFHEIPFNTSMWMNPLFDRFVTHCGYQFAVVNDCFSYTKELYNNEHHINPLYFLQKSTNCSFDEVYKKVINFNNEMVQEILNDEKMLLESITEGEDRENLRFFTSSMKLILGGNFKHSLGCSRYFHPNSPFIEQIKHDNVEQYKNMAKDFFTS